MAGVDLLNAFPRSKMAKAVRLGQSRFVSGDDISIPGTILTANASTGVTELVPGVGTVKSGVATITGAATLTTANLLALAGLTTAFASLDVAIVTSTAGVTITQGAGSIVLPQGASLHLPGPITPTQSPVTITTLAGDVVTVTWIGE